MNELQKLESFNQELALAESYEEIKIIKTAATAWQRFQKDISVGVDAQNKTGRFINAANAKLGTWLNDNFPSSNSGRNGRSLVPKENQAKMPATKKESAAARQMVDDDKRIKAEDAIEDAGGVITISETIKAIKNPNIAQLYTGNNEWYTPAKYIESARSAMGSIDLDPASNDIAQEIVKADEYYTEETDGLDKDWIGNIWLNPPYEASLIKQFINKLIESNVKQYIILTNNSTDTSWWHKLANDGAAVCFTSGRISFYNESLKSAPTNGQNFFYKGNNVDKFINEFSQFGKVLYL